MDYGLIAEHLPHSYSKAIHEMFGFYEYELKELAPDELGDFLRRREFKGINVTIPYKEAVIPYLDAVDEKAAKIGAVNTIVNRNGKLMGYNTDYAGLEALIKQCADVRGKKTLILGTGGTSKTAYHVLSDLGAGEIFKLSRSPKDGSISYDMAYRDQGDADIIVNTTPVGMFPKMDAVPVDLSKFTALKAVIDVIYNPAHTLLTTEAGKMGIPAVNGLYMLVLQAARALELFLDRTLDPADFSKVYDRIRLDKSNIVLTGMPGSGKSTVGKLLSKDLKLRFVDTDELIVKKAGCEITEIFASKGETYFRDLESEVIREVCKETGLVISTGGGAVLREENRTELRRNGEIVFLDRDPSKIRPTGDRPLADSNDKIIALYKERLGIYKGFADETVEVKGTPQELCDKIKGLI